jgi:heat shock protein HtpX
MAYASVGLGTHIYNNQIKSGLLLAAFPLLLIGLIALFCGGLDLIAQTTGGDGDTIIKMVLQPETSQSISTEIDWARAFHAAQLGVMRYSHWALLAATGWFLLAYIFHTSMIRAAIGARAISREHYPKYYNILENLCIARGIKMPALEIMNTPALNALATGIDESTHRIILTRGLIETLEDDEIEAVMAHELSHILHRDVQLMMIATIFAGIFTFAAEALYRRMVFRPLSHNNDRYSPPMGRKQGLIALLAVVVVVIGYVLAILIRLSLSRKREYLADAGAVDLTKKPEAMMRALQRIAGHSQLPDMPAEVQQMCIDNPSYFMGLFATHPPIAKRIEMIAKMTGTPNPWG